MNFDNLTQKNTKSILSLITHESLTQNLKLEIYISNWSKPQKRFLQFGLILINTVGVSINFFIPNINFLFLSKMKSLCLLFGFVVVVASGGSHHLFLKCAFAFLFWWIALCFVFLSSKCAFTFLFWLVALCFVFLSSKCTFTFLLWLVALCFVAFLFWLVALCFVFLSSKCAFTFYFDWLLCVLLPFYFDWLLCVLFFSFDWLFVHFPQWY